MLHCSVSRRILLVCVLALQLHVILCSDFEYDYVTSESPISYQHEPNCSTAWKMMVDMAILGDSYSMIAVTASAYYPEDLGNFGACASTSYIPAIRSHTQYCMLNLTLPKQTLPSHLLPSTHLMGLCAPHQCSTDELVAYAREAWLEYGGVSFTDVVINSVQCLETNPPLPTGASWTISALVLMLLLCLVATLVHVVLRVHLLESGIQSKSGGADSERTLLLNGSAEKRDASTLKIHPLILKFSLITSMRSLVRPVKSVPRELQILNGIRFFSILWIVLGHTISFSMQTDLSNSYLLMFTKEKDWTFQFVPAAEFAVDAFFLLSGFLATYTLLRVSARTAASAVSGVLFTLRAYAHRYIRLTPSYAVVLWFLVTTYSSCGGGPLWSVAEGTIHGDDSCTSYWWTNLLYIQNLFPRQFDSPSPPSLGLGCMMWAWYLANDMQLFLLVPLLVLMYFRLGLWKTISIVGSLVAVGIGSTAYVFHADVPSEYCSLLPNTPETISALYVKPWTRCTPYLVGVILALWYFDQRRRPRSGQNDGSHKYTADDRLFPLKRWLTIVVFLMAIGTILFLTYVQVSVFNRPPTGPLTCNWSRLLILLYTTLSRFLYSVGLASLIFLCVTGNAQWLVRILGADIFTPFARLTYGIYLVHPMVIMLLVLTQSTPLDFTVINIAMQFTASAVFSIVFSFFLYVVVEYPISGSLMYVIARK